MIGPGARAWAARLVCDTLGHPAIIEDLRYISGFAHIRISVVGALCPRCRRMVSFAPTDHVHTAQETAMPKKLDHMIERSCGCLYDLTTGQIEHQCKACLAREDEEVSPEVDA